MLGPQVVDSSSSSSTTSSSWQGRFRFLLVWDCFSRSCFCKNPPQVVQGLSCFLNRFGSCIRRRESGAFLFLRSVDILPNSSYSHCALAIWPKGKRSAFLSDYSCVFTLERIHCRCLHSHCDQYTPSGPYQTSQGEEERKKET